MPKPLRNAATTVTVIAWALMLLDVVPFGPDPSEEAGRLALLVAGVGTLEWVVRRLMVPAHELYMAGKMIGRMEAQAERDSDKVACLDERRTLRSVTRF